jgi:uncharacterized iron-regulated membrane protein
LTYNRVRGIFVAAHRYAGLAMAAFLILEGLTGAALSFQTEIERAIVPQFYAKPRPGPRLPIGKLAELAAALVPDAQVDYLYAHPDQTFVRVEPRPGRESVVDYDQLFLDPWTGAELGRRRFGDLSQGAANVMPFIYNLHAWLNTGSTGRTVLGVVAIVWSLDCFIAFYLTLPAVAAGFLRRWKLAWTVKLDAGAFRANFDLHRASGLWLWPVLFAFAWSSVMLEIPSVYDSVTQVLFDYRPDAAMLDFSKPHGPTPPKLDWIAAERTGARLLAQQGLRHGFRVTGPPDALAYIPEASVYSYGAPTTLDVRGTVSGTAVWLDADTGAFRDVEIPTRWHLGNTVGTWLWAIHFADVGDSTLFRAFVALVGLVIAGLSVTGAYIWLKKRAARSASRKASSNVNALTQSEGTRDHG